jgi:hypothetical protein
MRPKTLALFIFFLFAAAMVARFCVYRYGLLPVTQEAVLKKALAIRVHFYLDQQMNIRDINESAQVRELLGLLRMTDDPRTRYHYAFSRMGAPGGARPEPALDFVMPGGGRFGSNSTFELVGQNRMGSFDVAPAFFHKINEILSQREGRPIDVFKNN